jgi:hypothetical protein
VCVHRKDSVPLLVSYSISHGFEFSLSCSALVASLKSDLCPAQELVFPCMFTDSYRWKSVLFLSLSDLRFEFF